MKSLFQKKLFKSLFLLLTLFIFSYSYAEDIKIDEETSFELKKSEDACKRGDAEGCNTAASILFSFKMYKEAFNLFKKGCDNLNNAISCYNVGDFFFNGYDGIKKDEKKAIEYWKKACELSIKSDEKYCGGCYSLGNLFIDKNKPKKALHYFSLDCSKNCCEACFEIENMYKNKLISKKDFSYIKKSNKKTFETCDFLKRLSQSSGEIEE